MGPFIWSNLVAMPPPSSFTTAVAVASRPGEAFVGMDNSKLYRSTGGPFTEVAGFLMASLNDVHVTPMGKVFVVSATRSAAHCLAADCSVAANFTTAMTVSTADFFVSLCGAGERVFAVGSRDSGSTGLLYEFDGVSAWTKVSNNLGVASPSECQVGPGGEVYVVGSLGVVRYDLGALTPETVNLNGQPAAGWTSIALSVRAGAIAEAMIVGGGSGYRFARRDQATSSWTSLMPQPPGTSLSTVVAITPTEFLAAGSGSAANRFMSWNGTSWAPSVPAPPNTISSVRDATVTDTREVFLVGIDSSSAYSIIRGRR